MTAEPEAQSNAARHGMRPPKEHCVRRGNAYGSARRCTRISQAQTGNSRLLRSASRQDAVGTLLYDGHPDLLRELRTAIAKHPHVSTQTVRDASALASRPILLHAVLNRSGLSQRMPHFSCVL